MQENGKQTPGAKLTYTRPELRNYGTLEVVTKATGSRGNKDNAMATNDKTA